MGKLLVTRNTLDQRVTYFGMNCAAGCGQAAMEDPVMLFAPLQVRRIRSAIINVFGDWINL